MLCNLEDLFTLIVPTRNRPDFVRRMLGFLDSRGFEGRIVLVDASDDAVFEDLADLVSARGDPGLVHFRPRGRGNAWTEIAEAMPKIRSKYVKLHHDDDFFFPDEVTEAIRRLEADAEIASAQGRFVFLERDDDDPGGSFLIASHDRHSYLQEQPWQRVSACMNRYCHVVFSVIRREVFEFAAARVPRYLEQGWFDQYAVTLLIAAAGKSLTFDSLFGIRQMHRAQHHRNFKGRDAYKHWPMIVASPDFSEVYGAFKRCLTDAVETDMPEDEIDALLDRGLVALVERAAGVAVEPEPGDREILARCNAAESEEHDRVLAALEAIRAQEAG